MSSGIGTGRTTCRNRWSPASSLRRMATAPRHEDDDEAFDASDEGEPHIGEHDEAILYAEQLDQLKTAGF